MPAKAVPDALRELAAKSTKTAHVYTADTTNLRDAVAGTDLRVLGPNCIGHYTPHARMTMIGPTASSPEQGSIAFVSQSGTYAGDVVRRGNELGVRFSFVSSVGNCDDVAPSELLAFCEADPHTTLAAFYLEDDSDARRFFSLAAQVSIPIVLFKGSRSAAGGAAAASHTGALASDPQLLRAVAGVALVATATFASMSVVFRFVRGTAVAAHVAAQQRGGCAADDRDPVRVRRRRAHPCRDRACRCRARATSDVHRGVERGDREPASVVGA
ncbi:succinyl-CoA ligase-like protein [Tamaricihabitans halophyticus]|uniref:Succinyl-CoA ligase-like protein n=1 Tax=Tamaricihabitans halophyticus TaxID=1262583 RepID=A0A4R2Q270_9PSEU|nr:hypothetical protein [Tamaricihabitans halophyticus]TCP42620.1 succinyl-CoA ligase-like protein [Tamaricihabitans halophyticus]